MWWLVGGSVVLVATWFCLLSLPSLTMPGLSLPSPSCTPAWFVLFPRHAPLCVPEQQLKTFILSPPGTSFSSLLPSTSFLSHLFCSSQADVVAGQALAHGVKRVSDPSHTSHAASISQPSACSSRSLLGQCLSVPPCLHAVLLCLSLVPSYL